MRKVCLILVLLFLLAASAAPQRRGWSGGGFRGASGFHKSPVFRGTFGRQPTRPVLSGFGNVVFPGGDYFRMRQFGVEPRSFLPLGFGWGGHLFDPGYYSSFYSYTPFFGGTPLGGYSAYPMAASQPNVVFVPSAAQAAPAQPVVVNQFYTLPARSQIVRYVDAEPEPEPARPAGPAPTRAESRPAYYLIAMKSGVIRAAVSYRVEGGTLHYVDRRRQRHQAPLSAVDRDFSVQLNREREVEFNLPPG
ncbi:MAG: hypothetical protein IT158_15425 [Bryobacterales bacterium]|nr:hypothetical protein [Bryobacterales bacterium]